MFINLNGSSKLLVFIISGLLAFSSCRRADNSKHESDEMVFSRTKWEIKEGYTYPYRDRMLKDLMENDKIRGMTKPEVIDFLGEPTKIAEDYIYYRINETRIGIWPLHTKTLVLKLSEVGEIHKVMIHE